MSSREVKNPDEFRTNLRQQISTLFQFERTKDATNLEIGIYNWTLKECTNKKVIKKWDNPVFVQIYLDHLRSVYFNLKNPKLIEAINNGDLKAKDIAFMTHQELCPEKWDTLIKAKSIRDKNKFEQNLTATTDTFTCRKCKSNKCTYYQMQTRSADEPMTTFVTCIDCGNRWKC